MQIKMRVIKHYTITILEFVKFLSFNLESKLSTEKKKTWHTETKKKILKMNPEQRWKMTVLWWITSTIVDMKKWQQSFT